MNGDDEQAPEGPPVVDVAEDEISRGSIGTGGGLVCPYCNSVARHEIRTKQGTVAFQCDDCGTVYTGDGQ